jgi:hypothetical protein
MEMSYEDHRRVLRAFHGQVLGELWRRAPDAEADLWAASFRGDSMFFLWAHEGRLCEGSHRAIDPSGHSPEAVALSWLQMIKTGGMMWRDRGTPPPWEDDSPQTKTLQADLLAQLHEPGLGTGTVEIYWVGVSREYRHTALVLRWTRGGERYQLATTSWEAGVTDLVLDLEEGPWSAVRVSQLA